MEDNHSYQLLDFGRGEKLERFGQTVVRRQTPSVPGDKRRRSGQPWQAELRYLRRDLGPSWKGVPPQPWLFHHRAKRMLLKPTATGQVGLFPEQIPNWEWIEDLPVGQKKAKAINLFGYTGAMTLALASLGAEVTHVDSSRSAVNWARQNAAQSGLADRPIRWIVEDAIKYARRQVRKGTKFDLLVADPPSFGRGPKNEQWRFEDDIDELASLLADLASGDVMGLVVSTHTPGYDGDRLGNILSKWFPDAGGAESIEMALTDSHGQRLASGSCYRFTCLR